MNAGRELDALVAEKVMGWSHDEVDPDWLVSPTGEYHCEAEAHPHYSTDIAAAWEVVEKLNRTVEVVSLTVTVDGCSCRVLLPENDAPVRIFADTAPLAICLAALAVVGVTAAEA